MGRHRRKTIKRIKVKLPKKVFNCPRCYAVKVFAVSLDKKEKIAKGCCSKCRKGLIIPLKMSNKGTVANVFTAIDYYNFMADSLTTKRKELKNAKRIVSNRTRSSQK